MKKHMSFCASLLLVTSLLLKDFTPVQAQSQPTESSSSQSSKTPTTKSSYTKAQRKYDAEFAVAAASTSHLVVSLGKLAQQKAIVQEVKDWGKTMEQDYTAVGQKLDTIAQRNTIAVPTMMSPEDRRIYDDVNGRKYLGFDKKYLRDLLTLHQRTAKRYAEAATKLSNPELLAYVTEMLPKIRAHEAKTAELFERANALK
jgi:putative membrane protein